MLSLLYLILRTPHESLLKGIKWPVHWNRGRRVAARARGQEENENMQGLKGMNLGRRGKHFSQIHFSYITVFSRINLAYIWKSYTCLKCYSKEQFVTLKYFMWKLREKDSMKKPFIQSQCEREHSICIFPLGLMEASVFFTFLLLVLFRPSNVSYFNSLFVSFFLCCFTFFPWKATFLFLIFLWHISKDSALY